MHTNCVSGDDFEVVLRPEPEAEARRVAADRRQHRAPLQGDQGLVPEHEGQRPQGEEEAGQDSPGPRAPATSSPATAGPFKHARHKTYPEYDHMFRILQTATATTNLLLKTLSPLPPSVVFSSKGFPTPPASSVNSVGGRSPSVSPSRYAYSLFAYFT